MNHNRRGMVEIKRGSARSWVLPSAVETWKKSGWSLVSGSKPVNKPAEGDNKKTE